MCRSVQIVRRSVLCGFNLMMTYGFSALSVLVHQNGMMAFLVLRRNIFGGEKKPVKTSSPCAVKRFVVTGALSIWGRASLCFSWGQSGLGGPAFMECDVRCPCSRLLPVSVFSQFLCEPWLPTWKLLSKLPDPQCYFPPLSEFGLYSNYFFAFQVDIYLSVEPLC